MTCEEITLLLSARLDGELTEKENTALEEHLAHCPECRAVAEDLEALHLSFEDLKPVSAPEHFARGVMEKIEKTTLVPLYRRPIFKAVVGAAACLVLCVGLFRGGLPQETPMPTVMTYGGAEMEPTAQIPRGMRTAEAVCTIERLPEGSALEDGDWFVDEDGFRCLMLSTEQLEMVENLARAQKISFRLEGEIASAQPVLLRVTGKG